MSFGLRVEASTLRDPHLLESLCLGVGSHCFDWSEGYLTDWQSFEVTDLDDWGPDVVRGALAEELNIDQELLSDVDVTGHVLEERLPDDVRDALLDASSVRLVDGTFQFGSWSGISEVVEVCSGPMMNYFYPLPDGVVDSPRAAAFALNDLPLCVVEFLEPSGRDSQPYALALTGGGMDLSWEICEAFVRLGQLPPVAFSDLPNMASKPATRANLLIVEACRRAFHAHAERAWHTSARGLERLAEVRLGLRYESPSRHGITL